MSKMNRREFNQQLALGAAGIAALGSSRKLLEAQPESTQAKHNSNGSGRPNFVFISSDQHSFRYSHFMGDPLVKTPNLDKIAARGVVFENHYCGSPLCVPGRSCMMTGMYASDVNSFGNTTVYDGAYPTWGKRLRDAGGYYCWGWGKVDLNNAYDLGFAGTLTSHHATHPDITELFRRPTIFRVGEREIVDGKSRTHRFSHDATTAKEVSDFIQNKTKDLGKPWAVYAGFHMPHPRFVGLKEYYDYYLPRVQPSYVPEEYLENLEMPLQYQVLRHFKRIATPIAVEKRTRAHAAYLAMITELDEYIGQIYDAVEASGQLDNTYIIYTTDHGEALGHNGLWLKNNLYEGAAHIPLVVSGPGLTSQQRIKDVTGHIDLIATMMEWAGLGHIRELRGTSLVPVLKGEPGGERYAYSEGHFSGNPGGSCMMRIGDWKLMHFTWYGDCLFNLKDDPNEYTNLINTQKYRDKATELQTKLHALVDTEEIAMRAFKVQSQYLKKFNDSLSEEGLFDLLKKRLGEGQARYVSQKIKSGMLC